MNTLQTMSYSNTTTVKVKGGIGPGACRIF